MKGDKVGTATVHDGYWLDYGDGVGWRRVTRAEYITAERAAGMRRSDTGDEVATASFRGRHEDTLIEIRGTIVDPNVPQAPPVPEILSEGQGRALREQVHSLREELARAERRIHHLQDDLRQARKERDANEVEALRRAAPILLDRITQGLIRELTAEIEKTEPKSD